MSAPSREVQGVKTDFSGVDINNHALRKDHTFPGPLRADATWLPARRVVTSSNDVLVLCMATGFEPPSGGRAHCRILPTELIKVMAKTHWLPNLNAKVMPLTRPRTRGDPCNG